MTKKKYTVEFIACQGIEKIKNFKDKDTAYHKIGNFLNEYNQSIRKIINTKTQEIVVAEDNSYRAIITKN